MICRALRELIYSCPGSLVDNCPNLQFQWTRVRLQLSSPIFFLIGTVGGGVQFGPLSTATTNRPPVPVPGDYDDVKIGGMIGRGN
jgi:hypothetical protein